MSKTRTPFPKSIELELLVKSKRRCAFCYGLHSDARAKKGQIAHIDRSASNSDRNNGAFLCSEHHDEYDSVSKQTKGLTPAELKEYQAQLYKYLESPELWPDADNRLSDRPRHKAGSGISLDVYERRLPIYQAAVEFVRAVMKDLKPEWREIFDFAAKTDEALFLFDQSIADYLATLFRNALRLRSLEHQRSQEPGENFSELVKEESTLVMWFSEQIGEIRNRFTPFLRLKH